MILNLFELEAASLIPTLEEWNGDRKTVERNMEIACNPHT